MRREEKSLLSDAAGAENSSKLCLTWKDSRGSFLAVQEPGIFLSPLGTGGQFSSSVSSVVSWCCSQHPTCALNSTPTIAVVVIKKGNKK